MKVTKNLICTFMNSNTKIKFSTLYANGRTVLDLIWLKFQRQPRATPNVQFQRSQESGVRSQESGVKSQESEWSRKSSLPFRLLRGKRLLRFCNFQGTWESCSLLTDGAWARWEAS